jgi:hypothetical protein
MTDTAMAGTFRLADVFSKTVAIYRRRFAPFIILTVIASIPNYLVLLAIGGLAGKGEAASYGAYAGFALADGVTQLLSCGAVMYGVVQDLRGRAFSAADSIRIALRRLLPVLGVAICMMLAVLLGFALLVIPGLMLNCMFYVSMPACVAEQAGVFASLSRSRRLTKGYRWQAFGTILVMMVGGWVLGLTAETVSSPAGQTGILISDAAARVIINSFNGVLASVFYYKLRAAKEGVDIDKIASVFD